MFMLKPNLTFLPKPQDGSKLQRSPQLAFVLWDISFTHHIDRVLSSSFLRETEQNLRIDLLIT